ncbi:MAG: response regulator transcription factor [Prochloraceae cyanobacterium]|nr:response regulator transcription factor [Prochloraceae cyanobacterium]
MRILIVEDETDLGKAVERVLQQESYLVDLFENGTQAWEHLENKLNRYTVAIFDWLIPGISGLELVKRLRSNNHTLPVLMLTAKDAMSDRVMGLDAGADDYLIKPFGMGELLARIRALQRRSPQFKAHNLRVGNLTVDYRTNSILVARDGKQKQISLTAKEFQFLEYFMRHPEQIISSDCLLTQLWELEAEPISNVVAAQVRLVRKKLASIGYEKSIETVHGIGYRFNPQ